MAERGKIVITGGAGLVGQNLIHRMQGAGFGPIVAIDKHAHNCAVLRRLQPDVQVVEADLSQPGVWSDAFEGAVGLVVGHAQIGGAEDRPFVANNIEATDHVLAAARKYNIANVIQISSSVVNSAACDNYTETKKKQERMAVDSGLPVCVLRPTLMFGWFDRKHLGWLARFMQKTPVFPIPGSGRYLRQPLYVGDFCDIILECLRNPKPGQAFNISGQDKIDYIDLIRKVKAASGASSLILRIPYSLFWLLLRTYALVSKDPPFTTKQLEALVTPDVFEVIDWPGIFGVRSTPLDEALTETFRHPVYSKVELEF